MSDPAAPFSDLVSGDRELLLFAMTPPRRTTSDERVQEIADAALSRLDKLDVDALILYDLDDESDRAGDDRPFPYLETMDPAAFLAGPLSAWQGNAIVYRCVGKYEEQELASFLHGCADGDATVFVGSSSTDKPVRTSLPRAIEVHAEVERDVLLGGVVIPERHARSKDEHERLLRKQDGGVGFFVSQVVYDTGEAKDVISDYVYACEERGVAPARLVFTLSLCGSEKTLDFLQWLGVDVPRWVQNELRRSHDTLEASYEHCIAAAHELARFCRYLGLPFGFNVESVSTRRVEIEATVQLAQDVARILDRGPQAGPESSVSGASPRSAFARTGTR